VKHSILYLCSDFQKKKYNIFKIKNKYLEAPPLDIQKAENEEPEIAKYLPIVLANESTKSDKSTVNSFTVNSNLSEKDPSQAKSALIQICPSKFIKNNKTIDNNQILLSLSKKSSVTAATADGINSKNKADNSNVSCENKPTAKQTSQPKRQAKKRTASTSKAANKQRESKKQSNHAEHITSDDKQKKLDSTKSKIKEPTISKQQASTLAPVESDVVEQKSSLIVSQPFTAANEISKTLPMTALIAPTTSGTKIINASKLSLIRAVPSTLATINLNEKSENSSINQFTQLQPKQIKLVNSRITLKPAVSANAAGTLVAISSAKTIESSPTKANTITNNNHNLNLLSSSSISPIKTTTVHLQHQQKPTTVIKQINLNMLNNQSSALSINTAQAALASSAPSVDSVQSTIAISPSRLATNKLTTIPINAISNFNALSPIKLNRSGSNETIVNVVEPHTATIRPIIAPTPGVSASSSISSSALLNTSSLSSLLHQNNNISNNNSGISTLTILTSKSNSATSSKLGQLFLHQAAPSLLDSYNPNGITVVPQDRLKSIKQIQNNISNNNNETSNNT
jgi:hypothetical protein